MEWTDNLESCVDRIRYVHNNADVSGQFGFFTLFLLLFPVEQRDKHNHSALVTMETLWICGKTAACCLL